MRFALAAGCAVGFSSGWNVANVGAIASETAAAYGVSLAVVGVFTTALFVTHLAVQIPGGRASDRYGARRAAIAAVVVIMTGAALALIAPVPALGIGARAVTGVGTGLAFISGSAYVRASGGSPFAQGLFGGIGLAGGGAALAVVPVLEGALGWRSSYWTSMAVAAGALVLIASAPAVRARTAPARQEGVPRGVLRDSRLYRLAGLYAASLGLSLVVSNWVVELLEHTAGVGKHAAGVVGSLALLLGVISRPLGGWIRREHPERVRLSVGASLAAGALGTAALVAGTPLWLAGLGGALLGLAAGIPFAPAFTGAALARPDAPAAAVGMVNGGAFVVALACTPIVGLTFSLPGGGRVGFAAVTALWLVALALLPSRSDLGVRPARESPRG